MDNMEANLSKRPAQTGEEKETGRLEAFSDGVFAIAITLLILEVKVPVVEAGHSLGSALLDQWPSYLAYFTSFLIILIMWINHHNLFKLITKVDHTFLLLNGLLLLVVTTIPFPTSLIVQYIEQPENQQAVALVYSGTNTILALSFVALWLYASRGGRLLGREVDRQTVQTINRQYQFGPLLDLLAFGLAFVNAWASIVLCLLLALFFALPSSIVADNKAKSL